MKTPTYVKASPRTRSSSRNPGRTQRRQADYVRRGVAENPATPRNPGRTQRRRRPKRTPRCRPQPRNSSRNSGRPQRRRRLDVRYGVANNSATPQETWPHSASTKTPTCAKASPITPQLPPQFVQPFWWRLATVPITQRPQCLTCLGTLPPDHPGLSHLREVSMVAVSGVEVKWPTSQ